MDDIFSETFDVKAWLNDRLEEKNPETALSSFLIKLQLQEQEIESTLEYKISQLAGEVENYQNELDWMKNETVELTDFVAWADENIRKVETSKVQQLAKDHLLSSRMLTCKNALQEV
jgi:hypothetical protein